MNQQAADPVFLTEKELAAKLRVSVSFLQKDRREAQRIPYIKLGDRCLYDPHDALTAVKAMTIGGPRTTRGRFGR